MARVDVGSFGIPANFATSYYTPTTQSYDMPGLRKYLRGQLPADRWSFTDAQIDQLITGEGLPGPLEMYDLQAGQGGSYGVSAAQPTTTTPPPVPAGKRIVGATPADPIPMPETVVTDVKTPELLPDTQGRFRLDQFSADVQSALMSGSEFTLNGVRYHLGADGHLYPGAFPGSMQPWGGGIIPVEDSTGRDNYELQLPGNLGDTDLGDTDLGDTDLGDAGLGDTDLEPAPDRIAGADKFILNPTPFQIEQIEQDGYVDIDGKLYVADSNRESGQRGALIHLGNTEQLLSTDPDVRYPHSSFRKEPLNHIYPELDNHFDNLVNLSGDDKLPGSKDHVPGGKTVYPYKWKNGKLVPQADAYTPGTDQTYTATPAEYKALKENGFFVRWNNIDPIPSGMVYARTKDGKVVDLGGNVVTRTEGGGIDIHETYAKIIRKIKNKLWGHHLS